MTQTSEPAPTAEIIYVADPMCSWCWGLAPQMEALVSTRPDLALRVVMGGLRPGRFAAIVDDRLASTLAHHWHEVAQRTGQPFDYSILETRGWLYDTEPSCRAVVTMREIQPESTLRYFTRIQRAFYTEGCIPTDGELLTDLAGETGADRRRFRELFESERIRSLTEADFSQSQSWGITGFPTVLARSGDRVRPIARGYTPAPAMAENLTAVVGGPSSEISVCGPGEPC